MRSRGILVLAALWLTACAGRYHAQGTIEHPAELPVRAFAPVAIVPTADADSTDVATRVAQHLAQDGTVVGIGAEALRGAGIRVDLALRFSQRAETRWSSRPENVCGPYGCYVRQVTYPYDVLSLVGDVVVRIVDPATLAILAERTFRAEEIGTDSDARRAAIRHRVVALVVAGFDPRPERIATILPRVAGEDYADAIRLGHEGRWDDAVASLRALRAAPNFGARVAEDRAGLLVALAVAIRFSSEARRAPEPSLAEAIALVDEANGIFTTREATDLRAALVLQRDEARILAVQRGSIGPAAQDALVVPESYR